MESHKRSIVKSLSWRILATLITASVAWLLTGKIDLAVKIGLLDTSIKLFIYYAHERAWVRIPFGRPPEPPPPPEYQI